MSESQHTEAQMIGALKQIEAGRKAEDVAREDSRRSKCRWLGGITWSSKSRRQPPTQLCLAKMINALVLVSSVMARLDEAGAIRGFTARFLLSREEQGSGTARTGERFPGTPG